MARTPEPIQRLGPAFAASRRQFLFCCESTQTFPLLAVYGRGLLAARPRQSAEPIARASGTAVRTLQELRKDHAWSFRQARPPRQEHVAATLAALPADDLGPVGVVDETGTVPKGSKPPGVQRPWCGQVGKPENGAVTVHLAVARGRSKALVDAALFLPESWDADRDRCRAAGIPDALADRPQWRRALRQLTRAQANGIALDGVTFAAGSGAKPGFPRGLDRQGTPSVGAVPKSFRGFTAPPRPGAKGPRADALVRHRPAFHRQPGQGFRPQPQTLGAQTWQAKAAPVWLSFDGGPGARSYLRIWARNGRTGAAKYVGAGGAAGVALGAVLRVGFTRWDVDHGLRLSKSARGFRPCAGRSYPGLLRHLTWGRSTRPFGAGQAEGLRGENPGGDGGAGVPGAELALPERASPAAGEGGVAGHGGGQRRPPAA